MTRGRGDTFPLGLSSLNDASLPTFWTFQFSSSPNKDSRSLLHWVLPVYWSSYLSSHTWLQGCLIVLSSSCAFSRLNLHETDKSPGSSHIWHSSWCLDRYQSLDTLTSKAWDWWYYMLDPIGHCHIICWIWLPQNRCWRVRTWSGRPLLLIRSFCSKYRCY